jgi:hypothetical protein
MSKFAKLALSLFVTVVVFASHITWGILKGTLLGLIGVLLMTDKGSKYGRRAWFARSAMRSLDRKR